MTLSEIIEYVRKTPANTNPAVISTMIEEYVSGGGGSGDVKVVNFIGSPFDDTMSASVPFNELADAELMIGSLFGTMAEGGFEDENTISFYFSSPEIEAELYYSSDGNIECVVYGYQINFIYRNNTYSLGDDGIPLEVIFDLETVSAFNGNSQYPGRATGVFNTDFQTIDFYFSSEDGSILRLSLNENGDVSAFTGSLSGQAQSVDILNGLSYYVNIYSPNAGPTQVSVGQPSGPIYLRYGPYDEKITDYIVISSSAVGADLSSCTINAASGSGNVDIRTTYSTIYGLIATLTFSPSERVALILTEGAE